MHHKKVEELVASLNLHLKKEASEFPMKYMGRYTRKNELTLCKLYKAGTPMRTIARLVNRHRHSMKYKFKNGFHTLTRRECKYFGVKMNEKNIWL